MACLVLAYLGLLTRTKASASQTCRSSCPVQSAFCLLFAEGALNSLYRTCRHCLHIDFAVSPLWHTLLTLLSNRPQLFTILRVRGGLGPGQQPIQHQGPRAGCVPVEGMQASINL